MPLGFQAVPNERGSSIVLLLQLRLQLPSLPAAGSFRIATTMRIVTKNVRPGGGGAVRASQVMENEAVVD